MTHVFPHRNSRPACLRVLALVIALLALAACSRTAGDYLKLADELSAEGKVADARLNYKKAAQVQPALAQPHHRLALLERSEGNLEEALLHFQRADTLERSNPAIKTSFADTCLELYARDARHPKPMLDKAFTLIEQLRTFPSSAANRARLEGQVALLTGKPSDAIAAFERWRAADPRNPSPLLSLAQSYAARKEFSKAESAASEGLALAPAHVALYDFLYDLHDAQGQPGKALDILRRRIRLDPDNAAGQLKLARHYAGTKQLPLMEELLNSMARESSRFPNGAFDAGDFYVKLGALDRAQRIYETGLANDAAHAADYWKRIGNVRLGLNDTAGSRQAVERALAINTSDADAHMMRGLLLTKSFGAAADLAIAAADFRAVLDQRPGNLSASYGLAAIERRRGNTAAARALLIEITRKSQAAPARLMLTGIYAEDGELARAIRLLDDIPGSPPADRRQVRMRKAALLRVSGRYPEAWNELNRLIVDFGRNPEFDLESGLLLLAEHRYAEAEATFRGYYRPGQEDLRPLSALSEIYLAQGEYEKASKVLATDLAATGAPRNTVPVRLALADSARRGGNWPEALRQYRTLLDSNPQSPALHHFIGQIYLEMGEYSNSFAHLEKALQLDGENVNYTLTLAKALSAAGSNDRAVAAYLRAVSLRPEDASVLNNAAYFLADKRLNLDQAQTLAEKARQLNSSSPAIIDTLAYVLLRRGEWRKAEPLFRYAVTRDPATLMFRIHLAMALVEKGDRTAGRQALEPLDSARLSKQESELIKGLFPESVK